MIADAGDLSHASAFFQPRQFLSRAVSLDRILAGGGRVGYAECRDRQAPGSMKTSTSPQSVFRAADQHGYPRRVERRALTLNQMIPFAGCLVRQITHPLLTASMTSTSACAIVATPSSTATAPRHRRSLSCAPRHFRITMRTPVPSTMCGHRDRNYRGREAE